MTRAQARDKRYKVMVARVPREDRDGAFNEIAREDAEITKKELLERGESLEGVRFELMRDMDEQHLFYNTRTLWRTPLKCLSYHTKTQYSFFVRQPSYLL